MVERSPHVPVLLEETLEALKVGPGKRFIDATLGAGGHAEAILEKTTPDGIVLGIDRDEEALALARRHLARFGERLITRRGNFSCLSRLAREAGWRDVDGVLFDLGFSSMQVDTARRGFSFRETARLDMRMDPASGPSAYEVVNRFPAETLAGIFRDLGEEKRSRAIAAAIVSRRRAGPLATTTDLAELVCRVSGSSGGRIHPATRVFQALRMYVNGELENIADAIPEAASLLKSGGRLAVITYHSGEDRTVKAALRSLSGACDCPPRQPLCTCGAKAVVKVIGRAAWPTDREIKANRRARSAKLRLAEKV